MREIVALHDAGRAVSSVIDLDQVSRKIVDAVARTFDVQLAALWLVDLNGKLRASAARARRPDVSSALATDEALAAAEARCGRSPSSCAPRALPPAARSLPTICSTARPARAAGAPGPLVALPLERKARVVGVLAVAARRRDASADCSDADLNLLTTFADQAGAAIENAQLYQEVRGASEELDRKVRLRTTELTAINSELGRTLLDLREAQAQLVLSERMAGLGLLVAGVAHEINSPTAAIRGSIDGLATALARVAQHTAELAARATRSATARARAAYLDTVSTTLAERPLLTGLAARKSAREIGVVLAGASRRGDRARSIADLDDLPASCSSCSAPIARSRRSRSPRSPITSTCIAPPARCDARRRDRRRPRAGC